ncbi:MAG: aconitate hydratase AcnA [Phycisphaerae bacterium]|nr:aconitate hydratase AcnA [Phycisphaerae bacterium]
MKPPTNAASDRFASRSDIDVPAPEQRTTGDGRGGAGAAGGAAGATVRRAIHRLEALKRFAPIEQLPYSIRVLLEACLRNCDGRVVTEEHVKALAHSTPGAGGDVEIPFMPGRVVLQDFTGVPCVVDLAAMRAQMKRMGGDPRKVNPLVPCDLVIDHSVQVDAYASGTALTINSDMEFDRNRERYEFLRWGQTAFSNFSVVPPATGIVHQVNLEYLAKVVWEKDGELFPDSLVGTDSHTTMVNGLGVLGWGVGGIEAEAVMLGQPIYMLIPEVVGVRVKGKLPEGTTATDLVLRVTEMLRAHGVVNKFVEFFGPGLADMPVANRATIANMAPEYGATVGFFPVDEQTLSYLRLSGRPESLVRTVEAYCKANMLWRDDREPIKYSAVLDLDLASIEPSLAGPARPQDRVPLKQMKSGWHRDLANVYGKPTAVECVRADRMAAEGGAPAQETGSVAVLDADREGVLVRVENDEFILRHGSVVIAAITSCTNTSNPSVMIGAGLLAKKARALGLARKPWVKSSMAPGSKVVTDYLRAANLLAPLEELGFHVVGYGCTTCIGNSGPLPEPISRAIQENDLVAASVLSGNRNFEGRIHQDVKANYLASPPLVVAYALAGTVNIDLSTEPIGKGRDGKPVLLKDLWPTQAEIESTVATCVTREQFRTQYADVFTGSEEWRAIKVSGGEMYAWNAASTYIQEPPFFTEMTREPGRIASIKGARCLARLGHSVTTDHISPAGSIKKDSPAGKHLQEQGVPVSMFNSYGSRRGNDRVMTRGTFANTRIRNMLAPGTTGGVTTDFTDGLVRPIFDAAQNYRAKKIPLVVLAGKDYGMGSSRDWAAKGTALLGVRAVIAESFERIHRSNLVGMGVLPLVHRPDENAEQLGLDGSEIFDIDVPQDLKPKQEIRVRATKPKGGAPTEFLAVCRVDTPVEVDYYRNGGILQTVLRRMMNSAAS